MSCPTPDELQALLADRLPADRVSELALHLDECVNCQRSLDGMNRAGLVVPERIETSQPASQALEAAMAQVAGIHPSGNSAGSGLEFLSPSNHPGAIGRLGTYEVMAVIGRGGMGMVLEAHDPKLKRVVAIKVLLPELSAQREARTRFLREARTAAAVGHDHIVTIHTVEEIEGQACLVMAYVVGETLEERVVRSGPLPAKEIVRIALEICDGLAAAHSRDLVHRDIKPANMLIEKSSGRVKIADFGLAKAVDDVSVTRSGMITGTPQYMAPEQALGEAVDHRADLFALGSVLYFASTGRPPFGGASAPAVLRQVCDDTPSPIRELNPRIPSWLVEIVDRLMAKQATERFADAGEVTREIKRCLAELRRGSPPATPEEVSLEPALSPASRRPIVITSLIVVTAIVGLLVGKFLIGPTPTSTEGDSSVLSGFVVHGQEGSHETLAAAATAAPAGSVIEIHGDGPFPTGPIDLGGKALTIRAARGFHPVFEPLAEPSETTPSFLRTKANLSLEGLEFRWSRSREAKSIETEHCAITSEQAGFLKVANCRIKVGQGYGCIASIGTHLYIRNSQLDGNVGVLWLRRPADLTVNNCIFVGQTAIRVVEDLAPDSRPSSIKFADSTLSVSNVALHLNVIRGVRKRNKAEGVRLRVSVESSIVAARVAYMMPLPQRPRSDLHVQVKNFVDWQDDGAFYMVDRYGVGQKQHRAFIRTVDDWRQVWSNDRQLQGTVTFADTRRRFPADFRVVALEPAPRTTPGCQVGRVGPGSSYHAWVETDAYSLWQSLPTRR